jgi:hypothetical protein
MPGCGDQQHQAGGSRQYQCPVRLQLFRIHANTAAVFRQRIGGADDGQSSSNGNGRESVLYVR